MNNGFKQFQSNERGAFITIKPLLYREMTVLDTFSEELSVVRRNIFDAIKKSFIHSARTLHPSKQFFDLSNSDNEIHFFISDGLKFYQKSSD